jgi:CelD/BcsL family acetyltransferase involved in cellulose biosynthesis
MQPASIQATIPSTVHWLRPKEEDQWDTFVAHHPLGLVYHLAAWKKALEEIFPHIRGRFIVLRDGATGKIVAGLPIYTVKSWLLGNRAVSVPFASFCDPLVSSAAEFNQLLPHIEEACKQHACSRLEVRTMKSTPLFNASSLVPASVHKHHYLPLDKDAATLFRSFAKSSICHKINRASRAGVTVVEQERRDSVKTFHAILSQTRRRLSLPPIPFTFFAAMQRWLWPQRMKLFFAFHNGEPVGCHLILIVGNLWISEYSGNVDNAAPGVNQLLYWETIKRAQDAGATVFSFGRTASSNEGLLSYKRRWATVEEDLIDFALPLKATALSSAPKMTDPKKSWRYRSLRSLIGKAPTPVYRLIGAFCYRHLG